MSVDEQEFYDLSELVANHEDLILKLQDRVNKLEGRRNRIGRPPIPASGDLAADAARVASAMLGAERNGPPWWVQFGHENPRLRRLVQEWARGVKLEVESEDESLQDESKPGKLAP